MRAFLLSTQPLPSGAGSVLRPDPEQLYQAVALSQWYSSVEAPEALLHSSVLASDQDGIPGALALTAQVLEALKIAPDDTLVLFENGPVLHDKASFLEQAQDASEDDPPLFLWVAFELREHGDGTRSLMTHGAVGLGSPMEIEVDRSQRGVEDLLERAADGVLVALAAGAEIADGDTIELSQDRVRVRIQPSLRGTGDKAFRLRIP